MLSKLGHTFNGRFQMGWRDGDKVPEALHNIRVRYPLSAVGSVSMTAHLAHSLAKVARS